VGLIASVPLAAGKKKEKANSVPAQMEEQKRAVHALNRLTFGPRPGDMQRVMTVGVDKWIEQQLHPEKIDDSALEARLAPFRTLRMNARQMMQEFPPPGAIKAVMNGKRPLPADPTKRAIYEAQVERMQQKQERKQEAVKNTPQANATTDADNPPNNAAREEGLSDEQMAQRRQDRLNVEARVEDLLSLPPDQRMKEILNMSPEELRASLKGPKLEALMQGMSPPQKETLLALNNPQQVIASELTQAKVL